MSNRVWTKREPIWKQSKKDAPFCSDCNQELDYMDMVNDNSSCKCGNWSYTYRGQIEFKPRLADNPLKKEVSNE